MNSPGDDAAVVGNGASGAVIRSQNASVAEVDPGPEALVAEVDQERDDLDALSGRESGVHVGRGIGEDRDSAHGGISSGLGQPWLQA